MKYNRIILGVFLLLILTLVNVYAQETLPASGGEASGDGGSASYTLGQVAYSYNTGTGGSSTEGIQQPYEAYVVTGMENTEDISLITSAYPNPTTGALTLKVENHETEKMTYGLYDVNGILLNNKKLTGIKTNIDMDALAPAVYLLKVIDKDVAVKVFKIIKN